MFWICQCISYKPRAFKHEPIGFLAFDVSLLFLSPDIIHLRNSQVSGLSMKNLLSVKFTVLLFCIVLESVCIFFIGN